MSYTKEEIDKILNEKLARNRFRNYSITTRRITEAKNEIKNEINNNIEDLKKKNEENSKIHNDLHESHLNEHDKTVCQITDLGPKEDKNIFDDMENLSWFDGETNDEINKFFVKYGLAVLAGGIITIAFFIPYGIIRGFFNTIYMKSISKSKVSEKELDSITKSQRQMQRPIGQ